MIKTSRQLKDLINNLSRKNAADAQLLMRNYMMERFLERVSLSPFRDKFILKGGMLVAAMVGLDARATMDIDATIQGTTVGVDQVNDIVSEIISVPVDDGVSFSLKSVSEIMDEAEYPQILPEFSYTDTPGVLRTIHKAAAIEQLSEFLFITRHRSIPRFFGFFAWGDCSCWGLRMSLSALRRMMRPLSEMWTVISFKSLEISSWGRTIMAPLKRKLPRTVPNT